MSDAPEGQGSTAKDANERIPAHEEVPPAINKGEEANNYEELVVWSWPWFKKQITIALIVEVLIFATTIKIACIYSGQLDAMITQNKNTLEAFHTDERAWIGIEPLKPKLKAPASAKFTALYTYELYLRNSGKTVARCVEVRLPRGASGSSADFVNHEDWIANLQDKFLLGQFKGSEGIPITRSSPQAIAPGQVAPIPIDIYGQAPQVFTNSQQIWSFVGRVDYIDEFSVRHWVKFCMFIAQRDGSLGYCKYGNDEDRNPEIPPAVKPSCPVTQPS